MTILFSDIVGIVWFMIEISCIGTLHYKSLISSVQYSYVQNRYPINGYRNNVGHKYINFKIMQSSILVVRLGAFG